MRARRLRPLIGLLSAIFFRESLPSRTRFSVARSGLLSASLRACLPFLTAFSATSGATPLEIKNLVRALVGISRGSSLAAGIARAIVSIAPPAAPAKSMVPGDSKSSSSESCSAVICASPVIVKAEGRKAPIPAPTVAVKAATGVAAAAAAPATPAPIAIPKEGNVSPRV